MCASVHISDRSDQLTAQLLLLYSLVFLLLSIVVNPPSSSCSRFRSCSRPLTTESDSLLSISNFLGREASQNQIPSVSPALPRFRATIFICNDRVPALALNLNCSPSAPEYLLRGRDPPLSADSFTRRKFMGEWVIGAFINLFGSIAINFGTNLLKLGHNERERHSMLESNGTNGKTPMKPIIYFQTWRVGIVFFILGNCLNFISFGYAAQSLLAALGSVQFVSNIAFAYFVLHKMVTVKVMVATAFIVLGNVFLVAFGNHQSPVYTPEQLLEKYGNINFLLYCVILILAVALHHSIYRRGELLLSASGQDLRPYWHMLLPFSYAIVSGAVGSCSVLFAKSLSILLRLAMSSDYQLHSWFAYSLLLLFLSTAGFWMARLNEGLSLFDAILIVPMFQIAWTFFSICTGFIYFKEYQVLDALRTAMFILGMMSVFIGIFLLAPDESRDSEFKDNSSFDFGTSTSISAEEERLIVASEEAENRDIRSFSQGLWLRITDLIAKAKAAFAFSLGFGEDSLTASAVLVMPMVSSRMTGFKGTGFDRSKFFSMRKSDWSKITMDEDLKVLDANIGFSQSI